MTVWTYSLTHEEEGRCCEIGFERQKPYFGDPTRNRNYSEGDRWELFQHIQCAEAELAVARMLGYTDFYPHFNTWKTELDIPGFEVRYSRTKSNGHVLRFVKGVDSRENDTPYILVVGGQEERTMRSAKDGFPVKPYTAVGWYWASEAQQSHFSHPFNDRKFEVPASQLRSMDELLPIRNHNLGLK